MCLRAEELRSHAIERYAQRLYGLDDSVSATYIKRYFPKIFTQLVEDLAHAIELPACAARLFAKAEDRYSPAGLARVMSGKIKYFVCGAAIFVFQDGGILTTMTFDPDNLDLILGRLDPDWKTQDLKRSYEYRPRLPRIQNIGSGPQSFTLSRTWENLPEPRTIELWSITGGPRSSESIKRIGFILNRLKRAPRPQRLFATPKYQSLFSQGIFKNKQNPWRIIHPDLGRWKYGIEELRRGGDEMLCWLKGASFETFTCVIGDHTDLCSMLCVMRCLGAETPQRFIEDLPRAAGVSICLQSKTPESCFQILHVP